MVLPFSRALLLSTSVAALYASGLTAYAVGGNEPEFVADFAGTLNSGTEYYRSGGSDTTFSSVFTHTKGDNKPFTMTDSDGVLKWAPHNFCVNFSEWDVTSETLTGGQSDPDGGTDAYSVTANGTSFESIQSTAVGGNIAPNGNATFEVIAKNIDAVWIRIRAFGNTGADCWFNLSTGAKGTKEAGASDSRITSLGDGWYKLAVDVTLANQTTTTTHQIGIANADNATACTNGTGFYVYAPRVYRNDLSMVNNPDRGDSYVPTTTAARFLPRRNHHVWNGSSWENAGILIEPAAATNLLTYSNDFSNAEWGKFSITATNTGDSPLGTGTAWKIASSTASSALHYLRDAAVPTTNGAKYTLSVFAKAAELSYVALSFSNDFIEAWFNLSTGSVGTVEAGAENARIESFGNGWYRCSVTFTADGTTEDIAIYATQADAQIIETLSIGDGIFVAGAQLEEGSTPTSYIPTAGSTVTRAAETLTVAGANLPANTTGVSVQMQGRMTYADLGTEAQRTFWRWHNGASDFLLCDLDTDGADTGEVNANQSDTTGGAGTVAIDAYSPGINVAYNIASRHSNTDINLAVDGTAGTADATPTALHDASSDTFQVAHNLQGTVGMLRVWGVGLSDTDLESAS